MVQRRGLFWDVLGLLWGVLGLMWGVLGLQSGVLGLLLTPHSRPSMPRSRPNTPHADDLRFRRCVHDRVHLSASSDCMVLLMMWVGGWEC